MKVINKEVIIGENQIIIREDVERTMSREDLEFKLRDIQIQKVKIQRSNEALLKDFEKLQAEEQEINNYISQLIMEVKPIEGE